MVQHGAFGFRAVLKKKKTESKSTSSSTVDDALLAKDLSSL